MRQTRSLLLVLLLCTAALGQQATENCAIAVLTPPNPALLCPTNVAVDPSVVLDLPASDAPGTGGYLSLCGFDRVAFLLGVTVIDGPGPDFQIEEVNSYATEPYLVEVSSDGITWVPVPGPITGAWAGDMAVDIVGTGLATVNAVALIDASGATTGTTPGPDFDSIVAINYAPPNFGPGPRPYADTLISYNPGLSTTNTFQDGTQALGIPNSYRNETYNGSTFTGAYYNFVCLPAGSSLVVAFSQDWVVDGPGADLIVHEYYSIEDQFYVEASDDGVNFQPMALTGNVSPIYGTTSVATPNIRAFDLAGTGLLQADYFRMVSTSTATSGSTPGPDLDALEAVNFSAKARKLFVATPLAVGLPGAITLAAPAHSGQVWVTLPSATPPVPPAFGYPIGNGHEFRLPLSDPVLQFVLFDPSASAIFTGTYGVLPGNGIGTTTVLVPFAPSLQGVTLWWHSALFPAGSGVSTGTSNIIAAVIL